MPVRYSIPAPKDLGVAGVALWRKVTREFVCHSAEYELLHQLCATVDEIETLKHALASSKPVVRGSKGQPRPNPLLAELRQHRKLADQLTTALALPVEGEVVGRRRSAQAKQAAETRWRKTKTGGRMQAVSRAYGKAQ